MPSYIDSHAHLTSLAVLPHLEGILARAREKGLSHILNICTDIPSFHAGILLAMQYPWIQNAAATPPHDVLKEGELAFPLFRKAAQQGQLAAVGETGLDYHYFHSPKETQQQFLVRYLHLAAETDLPVIFHCREAFSDLFSIVDLEYPAQAPAILHCFTGTESEAEEVLKRGWFLSFSGIVTFKNSESLRSVAKKTPLAQLLIETDSPYLAPQSHRGKPNEPAYLAETAACIAALQGIPIEQLAAATSENAKRLFFS